MPRRRDFLASLLLGAAGAALPAAAEALAGAGAQIPPAAEDPKLAALLAEGTSLLPPDAVPAALSSLGGDTPRETVNVAGQPFATAARVTVKAAGGETNAVQLVVPTVAPVSAGDALLLVAYVRGRATAGGPASAIFTFEKNGPPWTKSLFETVSAAPTGDGWRRVLLAFTAAADHPAGDAMCGVRLALGQQTIEIGGLRIVGFGKTRKADDLRALAVELTPLAPTSVTVRAAEKRQTMEGFGGNYAKAGLGGGVNQREALDGVGRATLEFLKPAHARVGIPMKVWAAEPGRYAEDAPVVRSVFGLMAEMKRRGIPLSAAVWDVPDAWVEDPQRDGQRRIRPDAYAVCAEALTRFLAAARDAPGGGATVDTVSFNEADGGYQVKFTSAEIAAFIKEHAAPRFAAAGLKTKWLTGDTANGRALPGYARPLLEDRALAPHLGAISFHCWDALGASDADYATIAALGREFKKPVWCMEVGYDAQLWRANPPVWETWDNALNLARVYVKSVAVAGASLLDYWEYVSDYPLMAGAGPDGKGRPYPAARVVRQLQAALAPGARVIAAASDNELVQTVVAVHPAAGKAKARTAVVLVNRGGAGPVTLTGLPKDARFTLEQSTAAGQNLSPRRFYPSDRAGRLTVVVPARSVVTLIG